jgi:hypothetical protein
MLKNKNIIPPTFEETQPAEMHSKYKKAERTAWVLYLIGIASIGLLFLFSYIDFAYMDKDGTVVSNNTQVTVDGGATNVGASFIDDDNYTAEQLLKYFILALDDETCENAWNVTYIRSWDKNGFDWFCSDQAFGGVTHSQIEKLNVISQDNTDATIFVHYYIEDEYNGNNCFKQNYTLEKVYLEEGRKNIWVITGVSNVEEPYPCELID